jgi:hypothetical protein
MDFLYVFLGFVIFASMVVILPQFIFDIDYLFPIEIRENEININSVIIYIIFIGAAFNSWGTFQYESWVYFIFFWIGVSIFAFVTELIVEQIRWNIQN